MYGGLDISVSGMVAQRARHTVIASNIANANTLLNSKGEYEPYLKRATHLAPGNPGSANPADRGSGVHVADITADPTALRARYMPSSPYADEDGYVMVPDINTTVEQINAMEASRAYEANVAAAEATKTMMAQALRLLA